MVIKKHLCCQKIQTAVHLFLQVAQVLFLTGALHMPLWIAGPADGKPTIGPNLLHQVPGIAVIPGGRRIIALGVVPPQGQDILNPRLAQGIQLMVNPVPVRGDTGQVGQGGHPLGLDNLGDLSRIGGGTAPRPIGHAHKIGLQLGNLFHR